jgi:hypothetical protein
LFRMHIQSKIQDSSSTCWKLNLGVSFGELYLPIHWQCSSLTLQVSNTNTVTLVLV